MNCSILCLRTAQLQRLSAYKQVHKIIWNVTSVSVSSKCMTESRNDEYQLQLLGLLSAIGHRLSCYHFNVFKNCNWPPLWRVRFSFILSQNACVHIINRFIKPWFPALGVQNLSHSTTREVLSCLFKIPSLRDFASAAFLGCYSDRWTEVFNAWCSLKRWKTDFSSSRQFSVWNSKILFSWSMRVIFWLFLRTLWEVRLLWPLCPLP